MSATNHEIAVWSLALILPAVLFVVALSLRQRPLVGGVPARAAERIVTWYAEHPQLGLWLLLVLLPLSALILSSSSLLRTWNENPRLQDVTWRALAAIPAHLPAVSLGAITVVAAGVLGLITLHLMRE
jgi:ABC-type Fe3+ transport system permease subunit